MYFNKFFVPETQVITIFNLLNLLLNLNWHSCLWTFNGFPVLSGKKKINTFKYNIYGRRYTSQTHPFCVAFSALHDLVTLSAACVKYNTFLFASMLCRWCSIYWWDFPSPFPSVLLPLYARFSCYLYSFSPLFSLQNLVQIWLTQIPYHCLSPSSICFSSSTVVFAFFFFIIYPFINILPGTEVISERWVH